MKRLVEENFDFRDFYFLFAPFNLNFTRFAWLGDSRDQSGEMTTCHHKHCPFLSSRSWSLRGP
jgi:hypothetical protein